MKKKNHFSGVLSFTKTEKMVFAKFKSEKVILALFDFAELFKNGYPCIITVTKNILKQKTLLKMSATKEIS